MLDNQGGNVLRSEILHIESAPIFKFRPKFCSKISPNFMKIFRALFPGKRTPLKIDQYIPAIFQC